MLIEVMGRDCGYLALMAGLAGGAEAVLIPEQEVDPEEVAREIRSAWERGKPHAIIVVAEGAKPNANGLAQYVKEQEARLGFDLRVTIIGYVQRGGIPTFADRLLASRLGAAAVEQLDAGNCGVLVGIRHTEIRTTPLADVVAGKKPLDVSLIKLAKVLGK
jgi:6-phosphofructokinase 1